MPQMRQMRPPIRHHYWRRRELPVCLSCDHPFGTTIGDDGSAQYASIATIGEDGSSNAAVFASRPEKLWIKLIVGEMLLEKMHQDHQFSAAHDEIAENITNGKRLATGGGQCVF